MIVEIVLVSTSTSYSPITFAPVVSRVLVFDFGVETIHMIRETVLELFEVVQDLKVKEASRSDSHFPT